MTAAPAAAGLVFGSICSGIEAASTAWEPIGWRCAFASEIDAFPRAVLAHRFPHTPLRGDFTEIQAGEHDAIDILVGGTPCQSFSVAGLRGGMADERGNLALEYLRLADRLRPRWLLWENVPGVLSSWSGDQPPGDLAEGSEWGADETSDFGCFLEGMAQLGYGFAYRVLDAQFFGLAQRRKRVFVVGYLGDWRRAAAVLFEPACLRGDSAPRRQSREGIAGTVTARAGNGSRPAGGNGNLTAFGGNNTSGPIDIATAQTAHGGTGRLDFESETFITHALRADGFDASEDGTGRGTPLVPVAFRTSANCGAWETGDRTDALTTGTDRASTVVSVALRGRAGGATAKVGDDAAFALRASSGGGDKPHVLAFQSSQPGMRESDTHATLDANNGSRRHNGVATTSAVRRLTPRECERLQGFPDDHTLIPWRGRMAPDGPRYKALGNSMAVPVMRWIGERIAAEDARA